MVMARDRRKPQYTYAERVVGALSHLQREQKKHSVHVASLRAQVKRTAADRRDSLGPQWSNWISRAINKLEGQGVLETTSPSRVAFTSSAKKALVTVRRESGVAFRGGSPSKAEDLALKSISQGDFNDRGVKRRRRSSAFQYCPIIGDQEDGAPAMATPTVRRIASKGLPVQGGKAISKMTKAELQEVLRASIAVRPDATAEENVRLKGQIELLRQELREVATHIERQDTSVPLVGGSISNIRVRTQEPHGVTLGHPTGNVIRTESGSLIDNYSKRPTPAPSTPGRMAGHDHDDNDFAMPTFDQASFETAGDVFGPSHGLATPPPSTPLRGTPASPALRIPVSELESLRERLRLVEAEATVSKEIATANMDRARSLEVELTARSESLAIIRSSLANAHQHNSELERSLEDQRNLISAKDVSLSLAQDATEEQKALLSTLQASYQSQKVAHSNHVVKLESDLADLQALLEAEKARGRACGVELSTAIGLTAEFKEQNSRLELLVGQLKGSEESLRSELTSHLGTISLVTSDRDTLKARCRILEEECTRANEEAANLTTQLADASTAQKETNDRHATILATVESLKQELTEAKALCLVLEDELSYNKDLLHCVQASEEKAKGLLAEAVTSQESIVRVHQLELRAKGKEVEQLRVRYDDEKQRISLMSEELELGNVKVSELELTTDELQVRLGERETDLAVLSKEIATERIARATAENSLSSSAQECERLKNDLSHKEHDLRTLQERNSHLTGVESDLRQICGRHVAKVQELTDNVALLQKSLGVAHAGVQDLQTQLQISRERCCSLTLSLEEWEKQSSKLGTVLDAERARGIQLSDELQAARQQLQGTNEELESFRLAKNHDERMIQNLRDHYIKLRQAQRQSLAEMDDQIAAALPSPRPCPRSTLIPLPTA